MILMSRLTDALFKNDKHKIFSLYPVSNMGYPTGFVNFDFKDGYRVSVFDMKTNKEKSSWANIGLFAGQFITIVGKSGVAKTTFAIQSSVAIAKQFKTTEVFHLDMEVSSNLSRILNIVDADIDFMQDHYHYINNMVCIEDIFEMVCNIAKEKVENHKDYEYDAKRKNEFGEEIVELEPTIIIMDSIPQLITKDVDGVNEMAGNTYAQRLAKSISQFYRRLRPTMQQANIMIIAINHINDNIQMTVMPTQAQIMYLKQNERLTGGHSAIYLAQTLLRLVSCGKFSQEKDGFSGFAVRVEFIKSKTNAPDSSCVLIYDFKYGFDKYRTLMNLCNENDLMGGRNPYAYFKANPDFKFDSRKYADMCRENNDVYLMGLRAAQPILYSYLSAAPSAKERSDEEVAELLAKSYAREAKEKNETK